MTGNPGKRPLNDAEPQPPSGHPDPPDFLDKIALEKWNELIPLLESMGVLTMADAGTVAAYCIAWSELQHATELLTAEGRTSTRGTGGLASHPAIQQQRSALRALLAAGSLLGLDPSSRTRIKVEPHNTEIDEMDAFLKGAQ
jgi:P27 family predicted phage terminase small subunit